MGKAGGMSSGYCLGQGKTVRLSLAGGDGPRNHAIRQRAGSGFDRKVWPPVLSNAVSKNVSDRRRGSDPAECLRPGQERPSIRLVDQHAVPDGEYDGASPLVGGQPDGGHSILVKDGLRPETRDRQ
jgi:hypothetical protein